jgi:hypothetical protein
MSESIASQERRTPAFVGESDPIKPWSVEQDADALMDDLFADFDRLLGAEMPLSGETVRPEPAPISPIAMPALAAPLSTLSELPTATHSQQDALLSVPQSETAPFISQPAPQKTAPPKPLRSNRHWDKLLLAFACTALLGVLAWLAIQEKLKIRQWVEQLAAKVGGEQVANSEVTGVSEADAQFMNYMVRSLELIERKAANAPQQASNSGQSALPPAPGTNSASAGVPQVIYNIYQSAPGLANGLLPSPAPVAPTAESEPPTKNAPAPTVESKARPSAPAVPPSSSQATAPAPAPKTNPRTLVPAPQAAPVPPPSATSQTATLLPAPAAVPSPLEKYSLVGLIVGSDGNSAALFKVNGTTQRIRSGEAIGDSGWTLYSAGNQSAVVRRNGTVREIYVGQEF